MSNKLYYTVIITRHGEEAAQPEFLIFRIFLFLGMFNNFGMRHFLYTGNVKFETDLRVLDCI